MSKPKLLILLVLGVLFCSFSFVYEYAIDYKNPIVTAIIMLFDVALLVLNLFYLSYVLTEKVNKSILNSILCSLLYFIAISGLILAYAEAKSSLDLLMVTLETLVYLGPIIIILLPIFYFLALCLG